MHHAAKLNMFTPVNNGTKGVLNIGYNIVGKIRASDGDGVLDSEVLSVKIITAVRRKHFLKLPVLSTVFFEKDVNYIGREVETCPDWDAYQGHNGKWYHSVENEYENDERFNDLRDFLYESRVDLDEEVCFFARVQHYPASPCIPVLVRLVQQQQHYTKTPAQPNSSSTPICPDRPNFFTIELLSVEWLDFMFSPGAQQYILNYYDLARLNHPESIMLYLSSFSMCDVLWKIYRIINEPPLDKTILELGMRNLREIIEKSDTGLVSLILRVLYRINGMVQTDATMIFYKLYHGFFHKSQY